MHWDFLFCFVLFFWDYIFIFCVGVSPVCLSVFDVYPWRPDESAGQLDLEFQVAVWVFWTLCLLRKDVRACVRAFRERREEKRRLIDCGNEAGVWRRFLEWLRKDNFFFFFLSSPHPLCNSGDLTQSLVLDWKALIFLWAPILQHSQTSFQSLP